MQFVFPTLTLGFLLVLVPLLVHLINLVRHRRQAWAAMDFLLESYKKHRRWVLLKQWLLLLCRMAAMAALVAMLAGWISSSRLLSILGKQVTHHYVLLDDSYSMNDGIQGETAYDSALQAIDALVKQTARDNGEHRLTLVRWSRSGRSNSDGVGTTNAAADFMATSIPSTADKFLDRLKTTQPTGLELSPLASLQMVRPLLESSRGEQANIYIVSDFRKNQWERPEDIRAAMQPLSAAGADIQLIDCVRTEHENLAITSLQPEQEVWAAGVPLFIEVQVRNYGSQSARNVLLKPRTIEYAAGQVRPASDKAYSGTITELPPEVIDEIDPGEVVMRRFQVLLNSAGQHVIEVRLPDDSVPTDNVRTCTLPLTEGQKVLVIDGDAKRTNAFFLEAALNPGTNARTGLTIDIRNESFLRDESPETLLNYSSIFLLDIPRLDDQAIASLERFCQAGGGLCMFVGDNTDKNFFNKTLYRNGDGLVPYEILDAQVLPAAPADEDLADIVANDHPLWGPAATAGSPFQLVRIQRFRKTLANSSTQGNEKIGDGASAATTTRNAVQIAAKVRTGEPLIVDKPFGQGRVITVFTSLVPNWSTWAQHPTFVVFALRSVGYLGSFRRPVVGEPVGTSWKEEVSLQSYLPEIEFLIPTGASENKIPLKIPLKSNSSKENGSQSLNIGTATLSPYETDLSEELVHRLLSPGLIEAWKTDITGNPEVNNRAFYAPASEGNLSKPTTSALISALRPVKVRHRFADTISSSIVASGLVNRDTLLMGLLIALLVAEQALAYAASFHPPMKSGAAK
jgi:hypothetical protein